MFTHVVLLQFTPETTQDHLHKIVDSLRGLPEVVPSLASYRVGLDLGLAPDNAQIAVVAEFDNEDGYVSYRDDPTHVEIINTQIRPQLAARTASQFWT